MQDSLGLGSSYATLPRQFNQSKDTNYEYVCDAKHVKPAPFQLSRDAVAERRCIKTLEHRW